jgi:hypothetical protein
LVAAREIGYKPYKIDRCPGHSIWKATQDLLVHPAFIAGIRNKDLPLETGGVFDQPANFGAFVHHARKEFEWFMGLVSERSRKTK